MLPAAYFVAQPASQGRAVDRADACRYRSATMDRETLIFLHIPKTAGTTLNRIIEWQYNPLAIFTIDPHRIRATAERLQRLPEKRRRRLRVVRGHFSFGIHKCLPQGATYITMLREPVARVLSAYYFVLRRPLNPLHRKLKRERLGIEDCLRLFPDRQNTQCRFIAGVEDAAIGGERLLDLAKDNLTKSFSVVGLTERFDESLMLMASTFDWKLHLYENYKVAKTRPQVEPGTVEMIREHNRLDLELYEFGKHLFEENLARHESAVREGMAALRNRPKLSAIENFYKSTFGAGRFIMSKIASAV